MDLPNYGSLPGFSALNTTSSKAVVWGAQSFLNQVYINNRLIDSTAVDAGATPTTFLRAGLVLGKQTADGNLYAWNPDAVDGTEIYAGVLLRDISMLDSSGVVEDKQAHVLRSGPFIAADLLVEGTALTSSTDEHLLRRQMRAAGCIFDDEIGTYGTLLEPGQWKWLQSTGTTLTPTVAQNGTRFFLNNVAAVAVTLPALKPGLAYEFVRTADEEMVIASAAGDDMIVGNDLSADSVTWTTASQQIGAILRVESGYVGSTLKWLTMVVPVPYSTGAFLASSLAS